jgi:hypothetical protein
MVDSTESSRDKGASRVSHGGLIIVGFLSIILAITATQDVGAGILVGAAALSFGLLGYRVDKD